MITAKEFNFSVCKSAKDCGIYTITCLGSNKIYVGCSKNVKRRISQHKSCLLGNKYFNTGFNEMQEDFLLYGSNSFIFKKEISCDFKQLLKVEKDFINIVISKGYDLYNAYKI